MRTFCSRLGAVLLLLGGSASTLLAQNDPARTSSWKLSETVHQVRYDDALVPGFVPWPSWYHGYVVFQALRSYSSTEANVVLFDSKGIRVRDARIWLPDAVQVRLWHAVATEGGNIVATGYAVTRDRHMVSFIAKTNLSGEVTDVIKTGTFVPRCICEASDGTVWSLGGEPDKHELGEDFPMVRQFAFGQGQLRAYLPRSSFPPDVNPDAVAATSAFGSHQFSYLRCAKDRVSLYLNLTDQYIEINPSTGAVQRWDVDISSVDRARVSGLAVSDSGRILASLGDWRKTPGPRVIGLFELDVDRNGHTARWLPVAGAAGRRDETQGMPQGVVVELWGADGDTLVVRRGGGDADLTWVRLIPVEAAPSTH